MADRSLLASVLLECAPLPPLDRVRMAFRCRARARGERRQTKDTYNGAVVTTCCLGGPRARGD